MRLIHYVNLTNNFEQRTTKVSVFREELAGEKLKQDFCWNTLGVELEKIEVDSSG